MISQLLIFFSSHKHLIYKINKGLIIFSIPAICVIIFGYFYIPFRKAYFKESVAFLLLTFSFFLIILILPKSKLKRILFFFLGILLSILAFLKISFYYIFGTKISASSIFLVFETNKSETFEFLKTYTSLAILFFLIVFIGNGLTIFKYTSRKTEFFNVKISKPYSIVLLLISFVCFFVINKKAKDQSLLFFINDHYNDYQYTKTILKDQLGKPTSSFTKITQFSKEPETHVIIIGESTTSWHMQLYEYERETNPKLMEIKENLLVFEDVISPNNHTIMSLEKILSFASINEINKKENASVVQLANMAGYSTYWISNQRPIGFNESVTALIANAASTIYYAETDDYNSNIYDENIFAYFNKALKAKAEKKIIFIHLIGTHTNYELRYPKEYEVFKNKPKTLFPSEKNIKIINAYDNAVRYNDYIVRTIIDKVETQERPGVVIYFSDHGDEVFDTMDFVGHSESIGSRPMYEVPMLVWLPPKDREKFINLLDKKNLLQRKYNLEDFIHSYSDIIKIKHTKWDSTKSIFSPYFKDKNRLIRKGEDYDKTHKN